MQENQHRTDYAKELVKIVQTTKDREEIKEKRSQLITKEILQMQSQNQIKQLENVSMTFQTLQILQRFFSYIEEEPGKYLEEMPIEQAAKVVSNMDSDDAMDLFEELNEEDK